MSRLSAFLGCAMIMSSCLATGLAFSQTERTKVSDDIAGRLYGGSSNCDLTLVDRTWCGYTCPLPGWSCDIYNPCCTINLVVSMGPGTKSTASTKHCGDSWWCVSYPDTMSNCDGS